MILNPLAPEKRIILGSSLSRDHRNYGVAQLLREVFLFARSLFLLSFSPHPFILPFLSLSLFFCLACFMQHSKNSRVYWNEQTNHAIATPLSDNNTVTTVEMRLGGWIGSKLKTRSLPLTSTCSTYFARWLYRGVVTFCIPARVYCIMRTYFLSVVNGACLLLISISFRFS